MTVNNVPGLISSCHARAMYSPLLAKSREDPRYGELVEKMRRMNGL